MAGSIDPPPLAPLIVAGSIDLCPPLHAGKGGLLQSNQLALWLDYVRYERSNPQVRASGVEHHDGVDMMYGQIR